MKFVRDLIHTGVANDVSRQELRFERSICMFLQRETLGRSDVSDAELIIVNRLGRECVMKPAAHLSSDQEGFPAVCLVLKRPDSSEHIWFSSTRSSDTGNPAELVIYFSSSMLETNSTERKQS